MNKKSLGLAIAAVLASSNAAALELYNSDKGSVNLKGEVATEAYRANSFKTPYWKTKLEETYMLELNPDAKIGVQFKRNLPNGIEVEAGFDLKHADKLVQNVFISGSGDFGKVSFGDIPSSFDLMDKAVIGKGGQFYKVDPYLGEGQAYDYKSNPRLRYQKSFGNIHLSTDMMVRTNHTQLDEHVASLEYANDKFSFGVLYGVAQKHSPVSGVVATAKLGKLGVATSYSHFRNAVRIDAHHSRHHFLHMENQMPTHGYGYSLGLSYKLSDDTTVFLNGQRTDVTRRTPKFFKGDMKHSVVKTAYAGVEHDLDDHVSLYATYQSAHEVRQDYELPHDYDRNQLIKLGVRVSF